MELIDMVQCELCKETLEEFKRNTTLTHDEVDLLEKYTLFMEIKRLKYDQLSELKKLIATPNPTPTPYEPTWDYFKNSMVVTC